MKEIQLAQLNTMLTTFYLIQGLASIVHKIVPLIALQ